MSTTRIYGLVDTSDPDRIRYVGATKQELPARLRRHRHEARIGTASMSVYDWIREVGPENTKIIIIEECSWEERFVREAHWIQELKTSRSDGGFNDSRGLELSPEALARRAAAIRTSERAQEQRKRLHEELRTPVARKRVGDRQRARAGTPEGHAQIVAAARAGTTRGTHTRWHVNRGITAPDCPLCA